MSVQRYTRPYSGVGARKAPAPLPSLKTIIRRAA